MNLDANSLLLSLAIGCVGFVCFTYGRKQRRFPQMLAGVTLMVYPYFVPGVWPMAAVALAVLALMWAAIRTGM
jgi:hypothetical protein